MPKRPRSHQLEDLSRSRLHDLFVKEGWTVEDLSQDYGEDALVRIFKEGQATHLSFFVQAKATDHIEKYFDRERKHVLYPISTDHIEHWARFWEPVILTLWDSKADVTYWECLQSFVAKAELKKKSDRKAKTLRVSIPIDNKLNENGASQILSITENRFARFETEQEGADILIDLLYKELGIEIEYDSQEGILILPGGKFIEEGEGSITVFGKKAALLHKTEVNSSLPFMEFFEEWVTSKSAEALKDHLSGTSVNLSDFEEVLDKCLAGGTLTKADKDKLGAEGVKRLQTLLRRHKNYYKNYRKKRGLD
jgi:hypothetical protein